MAHSTPSNSMSNTMSTSDSSRGKGRSIQTDKNSNDSSSSNSTRRVLNLLRTNSQHMLHQAVRCDWKKIIVCCHFYTQLYAYVCDASTTDAGRDDGHTIHERTLLSWLCSVTQQQEQDQQEGSKTHLKSIVHSLIREQLYQEDPWGNTALHAALHQGSGEPTVEVIRCILDLEQIVQKQQQEQEQDTTTTTKPLLLRQNARGQTPLHIACDNGGNIAILRVLLDSTSYPQASMAMFIPDHGSKTVLDALLHYYELWLHVPTLRDANPPLADFTPDTVRAEPSNKSKLSLDFWNRLDLLLQAAFWSAPITSDRLDIISSNSALPSVLHAAAYCSAILPPRLAEALFRAHSHDDNTSNDDVTPLHVLVSTPFPQLRLSKEHRTAFLNNRNHFLKLCLKNCDANPTNARLLFHQAVASGYMWNEVDFVVEESTTEQAIDCDRKKASRRDSFTSVSSSSSTEPTPRDSLFQTEATSALAMLWNHISTTSPYVVSESDHVTGLYPFHLAAMVDATASSGDESQQQSANALDTIYQLLRVYPQVIQEGLQS